MSNVVPLQRFELELPLSVINDHTGLLGKTGSGKTSTGKWMVEQLVAMLGERARVCILDPLKSDWWGITASADGRGPGLPFQVLGGQHGHVPLHSGAGAAIAELVADGRLPLSILDMKLFEPGGHAKFFADFAPVLLQKMQGVLYLVLEEAHVFAPKERAGFGKHENYAIHYAKALATSGRSTGIRLIVATQRTQALHNALLGSCETMFAHRITKPEDQEPLLKWLKGNVKDKDLRETIEGEIGSLPTGTAWMCSGDGSGVQRVQVPRIWTYDNSATPKHGDKRVDVVGRAPVDHAALRARIAELEKRLAAGDSTSDDKLVGDQQREIERLRVEVDALKASATSAHGAVRVTAEANAMLCRQRDTAVNALKAIRTGIDDELANVAMHAEPAENPQHSAGALQGARDNPSPPFVLPASKRLDAHGFELRGPQPATVLTVTERRSTPVKSPVSAGVKRSPQERILDAIAWWESLDVFEPINVAIATLADYSPTSTSYTNPRGELAKAGLIGSVTRDHWQLTELGRSRAMFPAKAKPKEMRARVLARLTGPQQKLLAPLLLAYPKQLTNGELAALAGYSDSSTSYTNPRGELKALGLVQYPSRGSVVAAEILFP